MLKGNFKSGLKPLKKKKILEILKGKIDYSHAKTFGSFPLQQLPEKYLLLSPILNQGPTYHCTAYASCAIQESQEGIAFDPEDFFRAEGAVNGKVNETGYDLRVPMKTGVEYGFKPISGGNPAEYKEGGYFDAGDGPYSFADNIRVAMYLARGEKKTTNAGTVWYAEWTNAPGGIIPTEYKTPIGGHDVKIAGWDIKDGKLYMVIQNSYGERLGDRGLFYFPPEIINKEFKAYGAFLWRSKIEELQHIRTVSAILLLYSKIIDLISKILSLRSKPMPPKLDDPVPLPPPPVPKYLWDTKLDARHSVRVICDEEGLSVADKNLICAVIKCESDFDIKAIHKNPGGTTDYGICQFNDFYYIGPGKPIASVDQALNDPETCVRVMIKEFKRGLLKHWVCYSKGGYKKYL